ncbi:hypothetical protein I9216_000265 [Citrobacter koseri]|nr:hypothetical protein [Citrobacter koseri]
MSKIDKTLKNPDFISDWVTIHEAVNIFRDSKKISKSDIYRHAMCNDICLAIYFQSPIFLRKIQICRNKIKLRSVNSLLIDNGSLVNKKFIPSKYKLIPCTEGKYIHPRQQIIDTTLNGYEYIILQRLLAHSLGIPSPLTGAIDANYGITVSLSGEIFQVFEKERRVRTELIVPYLGNSTVYHNHTFSLTNKKYSQAKYSPMYDLPKDACFVIRNSELKKLLGTSFEVKSNSASSTRMSTPLSRMFWLACKNNEAISPLIRKPYKLLSIFERWASDEGITDRFSGDTLKTALERGSPSSD